jgi:hypothetical protein
VRGQGGQSGQNQCIAASGLTTAMTLPVVGHLVDKDKDLAAAYGAVAAVLALGLVVNIGVTRRETVTAA